MSGSGILGGLGSVGGRRARAREAGAAGCARRAVWKVILGITPIILTMIIHRPYETKLISKGKNWVMVYGRRKTGKTFLVRSFVRHDEYFFVRRDRTILTGRDGGTLGYEAFTEVLRRGLADGKTMVVDEFHRLGDGFFDLLHATERTGRLILVSSTLFMARKLLSGRSPLLGMFTEVRVPLISFSDCAAALKSDVKGKRELVELSAVLAEPLAIGYHDGTRSPGQVLSEVVAGSALTVPGLMGEIFIEEERGLSAIYEGISRAVATGKVVSGEISGYLFSRKLISRDDPSTVQQHLNNLVKFGILKRIEVLGKAKYIYKHVSPLARLFYYADEKYNLSEQERPGRELRRVVDELIPRVVEDAVRTAFAEKLGLREAVVEAADHDIDACLLKFQKPEVVIEVKWKKKVDSEDVRKAEQTLHRIGAKRRLMFVPDRAGLTSDKIEIVDVSELLS